jgi:choline dehydrogenase-like flavoprotein
MSDPVDAVIVGSGAGGAPLAARLALAGLKVVVLEAGGQWSPRDDFATDEVAQAPLFWTDERLSAGADPIAFGRNNSGVGVGGSTLHYTAYVPRAQPDDFRLRSTQGATGRSATTTSRRTTTRSRPLSACRDPRHILGGRRARGRIPSARSP